MESGDFDFLAGLLRRAAAAMAQSPNKKGA